MAMPVWHITVILKRPGYHAQIMAACVSCKRHRQHLTRDCQRHACLLSQALPAQSVLYAMVLFTAAGNDVKGLS